MLGQFDREEVPLEKVLAALFQISKMHFNIIIFIATPKPWSPARHSFQGALSPPPDLRRSPYVGEIGTITSPAAQDRNVMSPSLSAGKPRRLVASSSYFGGERGQHLTSPGSDVRSLPYEGRDISAGAHAQHAAMKSMVIISLYILCFLCRELNKLLIRRFLLPPQSTENLRLVRNIPFQPTEIIRGQRPRSASLTMRPLLQPSPHILHIILRATPRIILDSYLIWRFKTVLPVTKPTHESRMRSNLTVEQKA